MNQSTASGDGHSEIPIVRPVVAGAERLSPTGDAFPELAPPLRVSPRGPRPADSAVPSLPLTPDAVDAHLDDLDEEAGRDLYASELESDGEGEDDLEDLPWLITDDTPSDEPDREPAGAASAAEGDAADGEDDRDGPWAAHAPPASDEAAALDDSGGLPPVVPNAVAPFEIYEAEEDSVPTIAAPQAGAASAAEPSAAGPSGADAMAARLERIARLLREHGPTGALTSGDPLGALIAGYLLGSTESGAARGGSE